ncbi:hypothetical protein N8I84_00005 [Streptomyces cynarae]|uniref:Zinc ribbon domain-containing protein n=1 Tax=Streptomyces cynarae TaxID=2981134 RepID=A0ABY6DZT6_9ACTN|nr:hypothetical protein [Streptomyces cynarae]UXY17353.1 hypothetical protein N8I84_00005 [Streptomyces cynarae]
MAQKTDDNKGNRFCKACGTPPKMGNSASTACAVLDLPDSAGLTKTKVQQYAATSKAHSAAKTRVSSTAEAKNPDC